MAAYRPNALKPDQPQSATFSKNPLILDALLGIMCPSRNPTTLRKPFHDFILAIADRLIGQFVKWWAFSGAS
jgi:hypothetical protein